jgi:polar amino acid transport system permease protein
LGIRVVEFTLPLIFEHLILAARWTVLLSLMAFALGGVVGLLLLLARVASTRKGLGWMGWGVTGYVQLFQGTPLLMQLFLAYFGLALFGFKTTAWTAAAFALTLYTSAFLTEIWRGCVESIPRGQWYAARAVGFGFVGELRHIILPQAGKIAIAPTVGFLVQVIKGTALASVIGFIELTKAGSMIANASFKPFLTYSCVALCYFALCFPVSWYAKRLERRMVTRQK